jgi:CheY-like chemotaxis protein
MMINHDALYLLLADDDDDDRLFFKEALEEVKVRTVLNTVNDGSQLMNYLNKPGIRLPHIVFLDLFMPVKNGMECLTEIRRNNKLKDLTVAIYSITGTEQVIEEAFVKGANIYIKKPYDFSELKNILSQVINMSWQYYTSGLRKENFLLNINGMEKSVVSRV